MKKRLFLCAALMVAVSVAGCGNKDNKTTSEIVENINSYSDSVAVLNEAWNLTKEKFPCYGGSIENSIENAPGMVNVSDTNTMTNTLLIPEDIQGNVKEVASLIHMMNANTFTGAAMKLDGLSTSDVADKMKNSFLNNKFMCGMPDKIVVLSVGDYVVYAYGAGDIVDEFKSNVACLDGASVLVDQKYE